MKKRYEHPGDGWRKAFSEGIPMAGETVEIWTANNNVTRVVTAINPDGISKVRFYSGHEVYEAWDVNYWRVV